LHQRFWVADKPVNIIVIRAAAAQSSARKYHNRTLPPAKHPGASVAMLKQLITTGRLSPLLAQNVVWFAAVHRIFT
jgi:hypothetical protein